MLPRDIIASGVTYYGVECVASGNYATTTSDLPRHMTKLEQADPSGTSPAAASRARRTCTRAGETRVASGDGRTALAWPRTHVMALDTRGILLYVLLGKGCVHTTLTQKLSDSVWS